MMKTETSRTLVLGILVAGTITNAQAASASPTPEEKRLAAENAELKRQLMALQAKLENTPPAATTAAANGSRAVAAGFGATEIVSTSTHRHTPATGSCGANMNAYMGDMQMEPGSRFLYNPVWGGMDAFWNHPEGMWMANLKWMHNQWNGLIDGTANVNSNQVGAMGDYKYPYMMPSRSMTMDMFMLMPMYGVTKDLTLMGMINYSSMNMPMVMNMMGQSAGNAPMATGGLADTQIDAIYRVHKNVTATLGLSIPTGSIDQKVAQQGSSKTYYAPYDMQNGAGTWILQPDVTYNWISSDEDWNIGANAQGNISLNTQNSWSRGNGIVLGSWLQKAFGPATTWVRARYSNFAMIRGEDPNMEDGKYLMADYSTQNTGGQVVNMLLGGSWQYKSFNIGLEGGIPVYQDLNGLQLKNSYMINSGFQAMF
ncbi:MAG: hypothetical protein RIQ52_39 [Pseudomonadota bacterium]|jgi:hypothetical protein